MIYYHIPEGTACWRSIGNDGANGHHVYTTKAVTYTGEDVFHIGNTYIQFVLPAAARPWKILEVFARDIQRISNE